MLEIDGVFAAFAGEMHSHMIKEEQLLFPLIRNLERPRTAATAGSDVASPLHVMVHEHDDAGRGLARMRKLSSDFTPPADACNTFRAVLDGLAELEADTHRHVHMENSVLFPRALELDHH